MARDAVVARRVEHYDQLNELGQYWISPVQLACVEEPLAFSFVCPCGCGLRTYVQVERKKQAPNNHIWEWDWNLNCPTLSPSIRFLDGCKWHGYVKAGKFTFCDDSGK